MPWVEIPAQLVLADPNTSTAGVAVGATGQIVFAGTGSPVPLATDETGATPVSQPLTVGSRGFLPAVWADVPSLTTRLAWLSGGVELGRIDYEGGASAVAQAAVTAASALGAAYAAQVAEIDATLSAKVAEVDAALDTLGSAVVPDGSVTTPKIAAGAVTPPKIAATGTPSDTTYLRGDGQWATPPAGGASSWDDLEGKPTVIAAGTTQAAARAAIGAASTATATDTAPGLVERATDAEATAGTDTVRYVTPKQVADRVATKANARSGAPGTFAGVFATEAGLPTGLGAGTWWAVVVAD